VPAAIPHIFLAAATTTPTKQQHASYNLMQILSHHHHCIHLNMHSRNNSINTHSLQRSIHLSRMFIAQRKQLAR
jgi:hypothetical protein